MEATLVAACPWQRQRDKRKALLFPAQAGAAPPPPGVT